MRTRLTEILGLEVPIVQAPMGGGVAGQRLVIAVCKAGGLGMLPIWPMPRDAAIAALTAIQSDAAKLPFAVNLNVAFDPAPMLDLALSFSVPLIHFFWGDPTPFVAKAKSAGAKTMATVSSAREARRAKDAGVDILVAQGVEAGGHVWGQTGLTALVPAVVDACGDCPVIAAGSIADGRGLAAALMLGASGAMIGTALAVAEESGAHLAYKQALIDSSDDDTVLGTIFDVGWPNAPSRVLRNETVRALEQEGSPERRATDEPVAFTAQGTPIPRFSSMPPTEGVTGDVTGMALYAGQGVGLVRRVEPAALIISRIVEEAEGLLRTANRFTS